jgi:hypothetical protein
MKKISSFFIITIVFFLYNVNSSCQSKDNCGLILNANVRGCYNFPYKDYSFKRNDSLDYYLLDVKLINNSDKMIEFLTNDNMPIANVILTSEDIRMVNNIFTNSSLFPVKLDPGKEFSFPLILELKNGKFDKKIKLGWAYLTYENTGSRDNYFKVLEKARTEYVNVIWSDSLLLDIRVTKPIEVR